MKLWVSVTALMLLASCSSTKKSVQEGARLYNVGFRVMTMQVTENGVPRNLDVAVWYPTAAQPKLYQYAGPTYGRVARDAPPLTGHGTFQCWRSRTAMAGADWHHRSSPRSWRQRVG
jgi:hypothetical protein